MPTNAPASMEAVLRMYDTIRIGENDTCKVCRRAANDHLSSPISPWIVGEKFAGDNLKLVFVGKTARNDHGVEPGKGYFDARARGRELFLHKDWPYWSYTREIVEQLFGSAKEGCARIAFTNLVKCNDSAGSDTTPPNRMDRCLRELRVFHREVEILRPLHIVCYTGWDYDDYLEEVRLGDEFEDVSQLTATRKVGNQKVPWWHRSFKSHGVPTGHLLRTGHPQYKKREDFVSGIVDWVRSTQI